MDPDLAFQGRLRDNRAGLVATAAVVILVAVVGIGLIPSGDDGPLTGVMGSAASPGSSVVTTFHSMPTPIAQPGELDWGTRDPRPIDPGAYYMAWESLRVRFTMPSGWSSMDRGSRLVKAGGDGSLDLYMSAERHQIHVATDVCPLGEDATFARTGPLASDLVHELVSQVGIAGPDPVEVIVGTFPATKIVRTDLLCRGGAEGRLIWQDGPNLRCPARRERSCPSGVDGFGMLYYGTATIYVVDVSGQRLVIGTSERGASPGDLAEIDAILASIEIEPADPIGPQTGYSAIGRRPLAVDGLPIAFSVSVSGWELHDGHSFAKPLEGVNGQVAEAILYWTTIPDSPSSEPCQRIMGPPAFATTDEVAHAVAAAPGTDLVTGPVDVVVGGRPARYVAVKVREDAGGCDPGFFYTWPYAAGGAFWPATAAGDTIRVWIVDVDGKRLFIAGETRLHAGLGVDLTDAQIAGFDDEIREIVRSITFD